MEAQKEYSRAINPNNSGRRLGGQQGGLGRPIMAIKAPARPFDESRTIHARITFVGDIKVLPVCVMDSAIF